MSNATIDYTSKDYDGLRQAMLEYATTKMPEWQARSEGDFGVTLVELMAYMGDVLSYYGDRIQNESYLTTATQRSSLLQIANLLGYIPSNGVAATGTVTFQTTGNNNIPVTVPAGTQVSTDYVETLDSSLTYETVADITVPANGATAVADVIHGVTRNNILLGVSDGTPAQRLRLPETSVLSDSVQVFVANGTDAKGNVTTAEWVFIDYLVNATSDDNAFTTYNDETGATWVEFGDGINGSVPNTGLNIYATYRVGGGTVGNIGAGLITGITSAAIPGVSIALDASGVPLSSAMEGGADPESNDQIRANAPRVFRSQNRAVTLQDFADVALSVPGVLRANAVAGTYTSVTVYVVGPNGAAPSDVLIANVEDALNAKALAGTTVTVAAPSFIGVKVGNGTSPVTVQVLDRYKKAAVEKDVETAIKTLLSFASVDFGMRLTVSDFYSAIMSVRGVQWVSIPLLVRSDSAQTGTADMVFRPWEIPTLDSMTIIANGGIS